MSTYRELFGPRSPLPPGHDSVVLQVDLHDVQPLVVLALAPYYELMNLRHNPTATYNQFLSCGDLPVKILNSKC